MVVNGEDVAVESAAEAVPEKTAVDDASDDESDDDMPELGTCATDLRFRETIRKPVPGRGGLEQLTDGRLCL